MENGSTIVIAMESNNFPLSIIIVSFNTKNLLKQCIESIYEKTKELPLEIIVVDNASIDGSVEMIQDDFKEIKLIRNRENLGYAKANNQAMKIAKGEYFLLLNSDTIVNENSIEALVNFMENRPKVAAAGPKVLNYDGTLQNKGYYFPSIVLSFFTFSKLHKCISEKGKRKLLPSFYWGEHEIRKVDWLSGCCLLLKKTVVEEIGFLSEEFFMYGEDLEWCYRAKKSGYEVWYVPTSAVKHLNQGSHLNKKAEVIIASGEILCKKVLGIPRGITIISLTVISLFAELVYYKIIVGKSQISRSNNIKLALGEQVRLLKTLVSDYVGSCKGL